MNYKNILAVTLLVAVVGVFSLLQQKPWRAFGEVAMQDVTQSTTTPQLADRTNLCPANLTTASSTTGNFDFITVLSPLTADMLIMDATTTDPALRFPVATSSNIILWLPAGTGTTTIKMGVEFNRGLIVDYGSGNASTTIGYRCGI